MFAAILLFLALCEYLTDRRIRKLTHSNETRDNVVTIGVPIGCIE